MRAKALAVVLQMCYCILRMNVHLHLHIHIHIHIHIHTHTHTHARAHAQTYTYTYTYIYIYIHILRNRMAQGSRFGLKEPYQQDGTVRSVQWVPQPMAVAGQSPTSQKTLRLWARLEPHFESSRLQKQGTGEITAKEMDHLQRCGGRRATWAAKARETAKALEEDKTPQRV